MNCGVTPLGQPGQRMWVKRDIEKKKSWLVSQSGSGLVGQLVSSLWPAPRLHMQVQARVVVALNPAVHVLALPATLARGELVLAVGGWGGWRRLLMEPPARPPACMCVCVCVYV